MPHPPLSNVNPNPRLWQLVRYCAERHPELAERVRQAGALVASGLVTLRPPFADVHSEGGQSFTVDLSASRCHCADYENARQGVEPGAPWANGHPCCAHLLAAVLADGLQPSRLTPAQWQAFYRERERWDAQRAALQAGVKALL